MNARIQKDTAVIIIPGNGNDVLGFLKGARFLGNTLHKFANCKFFVESFPWSNTGDYQERLARLEKYIDELNQSFKRVVIIGVSAGAHVAALLALTHERVDQGVAYVGWLLADQLDRLDGSPMLVAGVKKLDELGTTDPTNSSKITVVRPEGDALVPLPVQQLPQQLAERATTLEIGTTNHTLSTTIAFWWYVLHKDILGLVHSTQTGEKSQK